MIILGIDVSKARLDAALWRADGERVYTHKAANDAPGAQQLLRWTCAKRGVTPEQVRIVLEATGPYHETIADAWHSAGATVIIANPKRVRDYAKGVGLLHKTDAVDARTLACYGADARLQTKLKPWTPPAPEIRVLQALLARLEAVAQDLQRERNRFEKAQATATPAPILASLQRTMAALEAERKRLQQAIDAHYDQHPKLRAQRDLLKTIPAVGNASADRLLCVLHAKAFVSARQAAAFCGLVPVIHDSGTSVHARPRLSKQGNARLRAVLYMAAVVATRHNPQLKAIYQRPLTAGKSKMAALGALMRRLVHLAYGILKHNTAYDPKLVSPCA